MGINKLIKDLNKSLDKFKQIKSLMVQNNDDDFELMEVFPGVFHVTCKKSFDLGMLFLRPQEFYESQNKDFKGKSFGLAEFMRWYANTFSGKTAFTYTSDWAGFNVPDSAVKKALIKVEDHHWTMYDGIMEDILFAITDGYEYGDNPFYLIGTMTPNDEVDVKSPNQDIFQHELAHALYYLDKKYKKSARALIKTLSPKIKAKIIEKLTEMGYHKSVHEDEIQAYMVSGMDIVDVKVANIRKKFVKLYRDAIDLHTDYFVGVDKND